MKSKGMMISSAATSVANGIINQSKGEVSETFTIKKDEMIDKINKLFLDNQAEDYKDEVKKIFSPWQKGCSVVSTDGKYELKTFIMGFWSKWMNLRSSRVWIYDRDKNICFECKAWSMKKVIKSIKQK